MCIIPLKVSRQEAVLISPFNKIILYLKSSSEAGSLDRSNKDSGLLRVLKLRHVTQMFHDYLVNCDKFIVI